MTAVLLEIPAAVGIVVSGDERPSMLEIGETLDLLSGISSAYGVELNLRLRKLVPDHVEHVDEGATPICVCQHPDRPPHRRLPGVGPVCAECFEVAS